MVPLGRTGESCRRPGVDLSNRSGDERCRCKNRQTSRIRVANVRECDSGKDKVTGVSLTKLALIMTAALKHLRP
jgi:hypothetical protein